ncbi:hypothetical protein YQ44_14125 [Janthinobacterium sp. 1_2014MBL_MicDiv]|nr:hypothetical protein YQ44_14125 [Janthinobacterium sp. 1_2014MBL_MicDiv]
MSILEGGVPDSVDSYMYRRKQMRLGAVLTTLAEHARVSAILAILTLMVPLLQVGIMKLLMAAKFLKGIKEFCSCCRRQDPLNEHQR